MCVSLHMIIVRSDLFFVPPILHFTVQDLSDDDQFSEIGNLMRRRVLSTRMEVFRF